MTDSAFEFAFITDPQIGMNSRWGLDGPDSDRSRFESAIRYVNENDIDFVLLGGDHINRADTQEQMDVFFDCLSQLNVPYYGVAGNHDQNDPREAASPYFDRGGPRRFAFTHKQAFFMGLDASNWRGSFGDELQQEEWKHFESMIALADASCTQRFLVMHWPLFVRHPHEEETYWNMQDRHEIIVALKKHDISCVISGHFHQDLEAQWHGVGMVSSIGTSQPLQYPEERAFKVFTIFENGWLTRRVSVEHT